MHCKDGYADAETFAERQTQHHNQQLTTGYAQTTPKDIASEGVKG